MNTAAQPEIIGLDVPRDWLDIHCLSDDRRLRLPNTDEGHSKLEAVAAGREALVCSEATGGHEWRLWASMAAAGIEARQLAPAQAEAFGRSRGASARTDRIDAELIARFMAFRPEAGRRLPSGRLRDPGTPATKRRQLVEMRKSARQQAKADLRNGAAEPVEDLTGELLELPERRISEVEERIAGLLANDAVLAETAAILQSVPGIGPVACAMPVAPAGFASSRARRLDPQHGLEAVRRSAAEGGEAAQGGRRRRRPQARGDRQRLVQIPPALGAANRMTDRGPSATAQPKKIIYLKAPQGCCGMESPEPGPAADANQRRQFTNKPPTSGSVGRL